MIIWRRGCREHRTMSDSDSDDLDEPIAPLAAPPPPQAVEEAASSEDEEPEPEPTPEPASAPAVEEEEESDDDECVQSSMGARPAVSTLPSAADDEQMARQRANTTLLNNTDEDTTAIMSFVDVEGLEKLDIRVREHAGAAGTRGVYKIPHNRFRHAAFRSCTGEVMDPIPIDAIVFLDKSSARQSHTRDLIANCGPEKICERLLFVASAEGGACEKICAYLPVEVNWDDPERDAAVMKCFEGATAVWLVCFKSILPYFKKGGWLPKDLEPIQGLRDLVPILPKNEALLDAGWVKINKEAAPKQKGRKPKAVAPVAAPVASDPLSNVNAIAEYPASTNDEVQPVAVASGSKRTSSLTSELSFEKRARLKAPKDLMDEASWPSWAVSATVTTTVVFRN